VAYVPVPMPDYWLKDEEKLVVGQVLAVALHTPGHTPGSMSFHFPDDNVVVAGDTLFRGSIGRTDLWGGDFDAIERSIRERLYTLKDATIVVTGHGPETEIGVEKTTNQFIRVLKKSASFVLGSSKSSTYPPRVRLRFRLACGLAGQTF
jgi:glyoxylase-like metal-dependent hydrolase (beta-lactamase superfamily II)